ncbi:MAG: hypothetical protein ACYTFG_01530 [Planctomycetota bacterium]
MQLDKVNAGKKSRGFRLSVVDGLFIAANGAAAWLLRGVLGQFSWIFVVAVAHFFLFRNVFRIRRSYELIWTGIFLANFGAWLLSGDFDWLRVLAIQIPVTAVLIALELRSPRYHGIGSGPGRPGDGAGDRSR